MSAKHLFISYSKQDLDFARYLRALLEAQGFPVWMDETRLHPGEDWWDEIVANIDGAAALLVVMSPDGQGSKWVQREILYAEKLRCPVFPILLAGEVWPRLADIQAEDMRAGLRARLSAPFIAQLRAVCGAPAPRSREIGFTIVFHNLIRYRADVAAFKFAQGFHGADQYAAQTLLGAGVDLSLMQPARDAESYFATQGALGAPNALFVGMPRLRQITYEDLRGLGQRTLAALARHAPEAVHLASTIHGPGFGKDETESLLAQFAGYLDAFEAGTLPRALAQITLVELNEGRAERLRKIMDDALRDSANARPMHDDGGEWGYWLRVGGEMASSDAGADAVLATAGKRPRSHVFVAMPASPASDDFFYYGVQTPVHALGLLCERAPTETDPDDPHRDNGPARLAARLEEAAVLIADLGMVDADLLLHLGYAWGRGCPVVLLAHSALDLAALPPALSAHPPVRYSTIRELEIGLRRALGDLRADNRL